MTSCQNIDCIMTASALRRLRDGYSIQCGAYAKEVDIKLRYQAEIKELNVEIDKLNNYLKEWGGCRPPTTRRD